MGETDDRTRRIVETAIALAERDGYDAVRLRDVASQAEVALGTVYRRFSGKEDILVAALEYELDVLERLLADAPILGATPVERMREFFDVMTRLFVLKPNLARALLKAVSSGVPEIADKVVRFHGRTASLIADALRGERFEGTDEHALELADLLQNVWFADLVGWAGGMRNEGEIIRRMGRSAELILG